MTALRDWLPATLNLPGQLTPLNADSDIAGGWALAHRLARSNCDFASMARLDRWVRKLVALAPDEVPSALRRTRLALLSSSTSDHLAPSIRVAALARGLLVDIYQPDYGQFAQEVFNPSQELLAFAPDTILFCQDGYTLGRTTAATLMDSANAAALVAQRVDDQRRLWTAARERWHCNVIQQLPLNPFPRLLGENESRLAGSPASLVHGISNALRDAADVDQIDVLDLDHWIRRDGLASWHSPSLWHRSKQDIHPGAAPVFGDLVARQLAARAGKSAKCLVLDLDNTLWGGVIGDDGLGGIALGQGSAVGEGHASFQQYAKYLAARGVILAVCSKNDDAVAREAFERHPEMILRLDDIGCFVANWTDKATNIRQIAAALNIGIDSLVFADDNPFERNLIREELPEVFVPEFPEDPADFAQTIAASGCFESGAVTRDDAARTAQYRANAERQMLQASVTNLDEYLGSLEMKLAYKPFDDIGAVRITQLINKTNQFNLTTRRYSDAEVRALMADPDILSLQLRLTDRFGDNGIIGIVIGRHARHGGTLHLTDWLMSCRVLGRHVEEETLNIITELARARGVETVVGEYRPTDRNAMVKDHYAKLGFTAREADRDVSLWSLDLSGYRKRPTPITAETTP